MQTGMKRSGRMTSLTNKEIGVYFNISDSAIGKIDKSAACILAKNKKLKKKIDAIFSDFRV